MEQQYATIIVLITGVFGGLGIVILLLLFCKHCMNKTAKETGLENEKNIPQTSEREVSVALLEKRPSIVVEPREQANPIPPKPSRKLHRQSVVRADTSDGCAPGQIIPNARTESPVSGNSPGYEPRGQTNAEGTDIYDRLYPEPPYQHDPPRWLSERESSAHSRPYRLTNLSTTSSNSNRGSRRTLQSSMESSTCTDNRSEITVVERPQTDWVLSDQQQMKRSVSQDEPPVPPPSSHLSAFQTPSPERRRQLSHREMGRPRAYVDRRIKSHDETYAYRLQKQDRLVAEDSIKHMDWGGYHNDEKPEEERFNTEDHLSNTSNDVQSNRGSPYYNSDRLSQHDQWLTTPTSNHGGSSHELWKLRSNLEGDDLSTCSPIMNYSSRESVHDRPRTPIQFTDAPPRNTATVCNVIYTSFDSENSNDPPDVPLDPRIIDDDNREDNFLHPPEQMYLNRRQTFQRMYTNRRKNRNMLDLNSSLERSFDSFDTTTTDGPRSSESSRVEANTTSFDSTTTNDSSADSSYRRQILKEAKDDSGYKSLEYNIKPPPSPTTRIIVSSSLETTELSVSPTLESVPSHYLRPASSRRRDFQTKSPGEQSSVESGHSSYDPKNNSSKRSVSACEPAAQEKSDSSLYNAFLRVFQPWHGKHKQKRDYSIDEKTDALFKEFTRYDPKYDITSRSKSTPSIKLDANREYKSFDVSSTDSPKEYGRNFDGNHNDHESSNRLRLKPQVSIC